jgi:GT2 family glycosyltransferase
METMPGCACKNSAVPSSEPFKPQWSWHLPISDTFCRSPFFIGCGFLIRRELFAKIGWYPDDFFLYQNEIDVSFQVRLQGYDIYYDPIHVRFNN